MPCMLSEGLHDTVAPVTGTDTVYEAYLDLFREMSYFMVAIYVLPDAHEVWKLDERMAADCILLRKAARQFGVMVVSQLEFRKTLKPFTVTHPGHTRPDNRHVGEFLWHERRLSSRFYERYLQLL